MGGVRAVEESYEINGNTVRLQKIEPFDIEFHDALASSLDEWSSTADEDAFREL